jgi:predicted metal-dependent hydrolase
MKKTYTKNQKSISYVIIKKPIKHTYFRLKNDYVLVTTNRLTSEKTILGYLDLKFDQFYSKINHQTVEETNQNIILWGKKYDFVIEYGNFSYIILEDTIIIKSRIDHLEKVKKMIYKSEMNHYLETIKYDFSLHLSNFSMKWLPYKLKYMKSKFGSYHKKHQEITLNTHLAKLDQTYLQYVLNHEYAHTKVFNHQKAFYHLLEEMHPNYKQIQKDLKKIAII